MTWALENAYGQTIDLKVLKSIISEGALTRQVLLVLRESNMLAAMALGRIYLEGFPEDARHLILEQSMPLGAILKLKELAPSYHSHKYFTLAEDVTISQYSSLSDIGQLYGRRVYISDPFGRALADVIEIIAPVSIHSA
jgi:hypothetical protein